MYVYVEARRGCWFSFIAFCFISLRNGLSLNLELAVNWWSASLRDNPISPYTITLGLEVLVHALAFYVCAGVPDADLYFCAANTLTNWAISLFLLSTFTQKFNLRFNLQGDLIYQLFAYSSYAHFKNPLAMSIFQSTVLILSELYLLKKNNKQNKTK